MLIRSCLDCWYFRSSLTSFGDVLHVGSFFGSALGAAAELQWFSLTAVDFSGVLSDLNTFK